MFCRKCTRLVACRTKSQLRVKTPSLSPQEKINKLLVPYHEPHPLILRPSPSQKPLHDGKPHSIFDVTPLFTYLRATHTIPDCALHEPRDLPRRSFEGYAAEFICTRPKRLNDVVGSIIRQLTEGAPHAEARDIEYLQNNFPSMQFSLPSPLPHLCSNRHPALPVLWFAAHLASRSATASALLLKNGVERAVAELYWDPGLSRYHCGQLHHACYMLLRSLSVHCNMQDCVEKVLLRQEVIDTSRRQSLFLVEYDEGWAAPRYELMHVM